VTVGCIYGLIGIGFAIIFNSSGVINFAQGAFVMLGGMITCALIAAMGLPLPVAALVAVVLTALVGVAIEVLVCRRLTAHQASVAVLSLERLACQTIIDNVALHVFGDQPHTWALFTSAAPLKVMGAAISCQAVWIVLVPLAISGLLSLLYRHT